MLGASLGISLEIYPDNNLDVAVEPGIPSKNASEIFRKIAARTCLPLLSSVTSFGVSSSKLFSAAKRLSSRRGVCQEKVDHVIQYFIVLLKWAKGHVLYYNTIHFNNLIFIGFQQPILLRIVSEISSHSMHILCSLLNLSPWNLTNGQYNSHHCTSMFVFAMNSMTVWEYPRTPWNIDHLIFKRNLGTVGVLWMNFMITQSHANKCSHVMSSMSLWGSSLSAGHCM